MFGLTPHEILSYAAKYYSIIIWICSWVLLTMLYLSVKKTRKGMQEYQARYDKLQSSVVMYHNQFPLKVRITFVAQSRVYYEFIDTEALDTEHMAVDRFLDQFLFADELGTK